MFTIFPGPVTSAVGLTDMSAQPKLISIANNAASANANLFVVVLTLSPLYFSLIDYYLMKPLQGLSFSHLMCSMAECLLLDL